MPTFPARHSMSSNPDSQNYEEFVAQIQESIGDGSGVQIDEDLYDEVFGLEDGLRTRGQGARVTFIDSLPRVRETDQTTTTPDATCPICLLSLASIYTEEEYAQASEGFVPGNPADLGMRKLPCSHLICGKCARMWLRLKNTCPLCRASLDPSVAVPATNGDGAQDERQTEHMLQLFRLLIGDRERRNGVNGNAVAQDRESFSGMYS